MLGLPSLQSVVVGATVTATSVGITARVLSDLNRLHEEESQIVIGAAVIDDVVGLVILGVVAGLAQGQEVSLLGVIEITALAFGFLIGILLPGGFIIPRIVCWVSRQKLLGRPPILAVLVAFALAWLAHTAGSAPIIGAFAAGVLVQETP